MDKKIEKKFIELNVSLVSQLDEFLQISKNTTQPQSIPSWENPSIFKENVLSNVRELIKTYENNIIMLAKFQVGLSKYFDFYSLNWTTEKNQEAINSLVAKIVNLSFQIIQPSLKKTTQPITRCGCHDNACIKDTLGPRYNGSNLNHHSNAGHWPTLPADQAKQFLKKPEAEILGEKCHVYRIIGLKGNPFGSWWLLDYLINCRPEWREK